MGSKSLSELYESKDIDGVMKKILLRRVIVVQQEDFKDHKPIISTKSKNDIDQMINQIDQTLQIAKETKEESFVGSQIPLIDQIQQTSVFDGSQPQQPQIVISQVITSLPSQDIDEVTSQGEMSNRSRSNSTAAFKRKRAISMPPNPMPKPDENFVSGLGVSSRDIDDYFKENK